MAKTPKFNSNRQKPLVLLSPLDWGLGHTTRCIPVIQELIGLQCEVLVACNARQKSLLALEFPELTYLDLPGYNLHYGKNRWQTLGHLVLQVPKMLRTIRREQRWLRAFLQQQPVDAVISDNRFGFYAPGIPSVFITHQLAVKTSLGQWADRLVQRFNYHFIERFDSCWVPDHQNGGSIAGELSNPRQLPAIPVHYLGTLSRLEPCMSSAHRYRLLIILSGPEPQRTIFEDLLLKELKSYEGHAVLVRALPGEDAIKITSTERLTVLNHVAAAELNQLICSAEMIISRSGYTTVMDLLKLGKRSILVPTPGQAEQEYLAEHLQRQQFAYTISQERFSLTDALVAADQFAYKKIQSGMDAYRSVINEFVQSLEMTLTELPPA